MNYNDVFFVLLEEFVHIFAELEQSVKWGSLVILPTVFVFNSFVKSALWILVITKIKDEILPWMFKIQKPFDFSGVIPIHLFDSRFARKTHDDDSIVANVTQIDIKSFFYVASSLSANLFSHPVSNRFHDCFII